LLLLEKARQFRERGELKEFHRIVGSILGLRKASLSVHEIEDLHEVIYEPNELRGILSEKYRTLFLSDTQRVPFLVGDLEPVTLIEINCACSLLYLYRSRWFYESD